MGGVRAQLAAPARWGFSTANKTKTPGSAETPPLIDAEELATLLAAHLGPLHGKHVDVSWDPAACAPGVCVWEETGAGDRLVGMFLPPARRDYAGARGVAVVQFYVRAAAYAFARTP